jgi:LPS-assembly lipoprotein
MTMPFSRSDLAESARRRRRAAIGIWRAGARLGVFAAAALSLSACGFEPLYATGEDGGAGGLNNVRLTSVNANEGTVPIIRRALERRTARAGEGPADFTLELSVRELAQPLAVQIDDSVTRYNYRLIADYVLTPAEGGKAMKGKAEAVASFNVVASQYSTLYAEDAAREKAARALAEDIERDILLKFAADRERDKAAAGAYARRR